MIDISKCKAANPKTCRYHGKLSTLNRRLEKLEEQIKTNFSHDLLLEYHKVLSARDREEILIRISEHEDISIINRLVAEEIDTALTSLLKKKNLKANSWREYLDAITRYLPPQSYGALAEKQYRESLGYEKVSASQEKGDAYDPATNTYMEIKFSAAKAPDFRANLVQIRPHHKLDAYHILLFNRATKETELFVLTKDQMTDELNLTGSALAHGTRGKNKNADPEYAIRFTALAGDAIYDRWCAQYKVEHKLDSK